MPAAWCQMPDGYRFSLDNQKSVHVEGSNVVLTAPDGSRYLWPAGHPLYAASVVTAITAVMAVGAAGNTQIIAAPVITNVVMDNPDITLANLIVTGFGFVAATVGKIYWDDAGGGRDADGYFSNCTFVSGTKMTAVYGGPGNALLGPGGVLIYYQDSGGGISNIINGTNAAGTVVSIP